MKMIGINHEQALWVILVFSSCSLVTQVTTCKCKIKHPQQSFCTADFVIMGLVQNVTVIYGKPEMTIYGQMVKNVTSRFYEVKIKRRFKLDKSKMKKISKIQQIQTPASLTDCAVLLRKGIKYVITGKLVDGKLWTDRCCWVENYRKMTRTQRTGLRKHYRKNCKCQVSCCLGRQCTKGDNHICQMKARFWSCYYRYGTCVYRKKGKNKKCYWRKSRKLSKCSTIGK